MSKVKSSKNRSTEIALISILKKYALKGWRRNYKLFGKPDFVFLSIKTVVFVDGCFWHGHRCRNIQPKNNKIYWENKIERNIKRDKVVNKHLKKIGWNVIRIRECELKNDILIKKKLQNILKVI